ncbi:hypothetical protein LWI29_017644 [Acer saccharum]|uniref:Poly(A) polymerase RNA-binding domain-containing protein n=1 Tax=Acer saccharum TaxID=4024 RepID=A0AA39RDA1_ACESA|nr:hypothetical protein LWI29_017644 [Acer saccharum]
MQEIELNKAQWSVLFEPYLFFEAYKNYLQVDMVAADADDLLAWKGWVESRFRQLTLKWMALEMLWSFVDSESRGSLQGGEHAADLDSLVENGCLNASGVYQNGLSEGLEVLTQTSNRIQLFS